ncbi:plasmid stabilization protein [Burkholderia cepacia]|uniref:plasmid stabilization protein n=1 Tax=Burkholderia cepacia TaxID=292 RepID=UPI002AB78444|nr:plasmid stabilization protein [Burkholderia cepacia]
MTVGDGARHLIAGALYEEAGRGHTGADVEVRWGGVGDPRARIEIRLTLTELEVVGRRAHASSLTPNRWIVALIRANLMREPQLGMQEMRLLAESNQQLATISRWLGQLVRDRGVTRIESHESGEVSVIREQIDSHLHTVAAVIRANLDRWSR